MITIYAEKPDIGNKIAAALDVITLSGGKKVYYSDLKANEKAIKAQQFRDGYLKIKFKGEDCYVTWGYGHLCELKQAVDYDSDYKNWSKMPMPFFPEFYDVKVKDSAKKQFKLVKDLMNKSSLVINATDYDREGELIFYYLYQASKCKTPFKRAYFSSITSTALKDSFDHLKEPYEVANMTNAGIGRSIADAAVGWNLTTQMTLKTNSKTPLSVGRVQTATLNILVKREKEIMSFKPEAYYTISALFKTNKGEEYKGEHHIKKFDKKEEAENILSIIKGKNGAIKNIDKKRMKRESPNLFNLSSLQKAANTKFGFTIAKTLEIAQQLYEAGFTTYPRTDSQYLTEDMESTVNTVLDMLAKNPEYTKFIDGKSRKGIKSKKYFDDTKVKSHFAIIPTKTPVSGLTTDQAKIYDLIARSVIMMLYGPAEIEKTTIVTEVEKNDFISVGNVIIDPQWMLVDTKAKEEFLPNVTIGELVSGKYTLNSKVTQPPKRYTEGTLVSAMIGAGKELDDEELKKIMAKGVSGIGTEATRASIVETIVNRGYAERDKKNIYATAKGIALIDMLPIEEIKSAELTAKWENRLNQIALGKEKLDVFVKDIEEQTREWVTELDKKINTKTMSTIDSSIGVCPNCGGKIIKTKFGYGCSEWKSGCKFTISGEISGKKITEAAVKQLLTKGITGTLTFKSKAGNSYKGKLKLNDHHKIEIEYEKKF